MVINYAVALYSHKSHLLCSSSVLKPNSFALLCVVFVLHKLHRLKATDITAVNLQKNLCATNHTTEVMLGSEFGYAVHHDLFFLILLKLLNSQSSSDDHTPSTTICCVGLWHERYRNIRDNVVGSIALVTDSRRIVAENDFLRF